MWSTARRAISPSPPTTVSKLVPMAPRGAIPPPSGPTKFQTAQSFLWHTLIESGESLSALTWEAYGRRLYDYYAFLEANNLAWNDEIPAHGLSVLSRYSDWSIGELALDPRTVNNRLALIVRFYRCVSIPVNDRLSWATCNRTAAGGFFVRLYARKASAWSRMKSFRGRGLAPVTFL